MAAYLCPHCKAKTTFNDQGPRAQWNGRVHSIWVCNDCSGIVYAQSTGGASPEMYPQVRSDAHPDLPDDVRENMDEAIRSINAGNPKSAVIMIRSALQAATRQHAATGSNLKSEIDDLAARHILPESLKDWAHEIRSGGNLVAHPEASQKVEMEDAQELMDLAESIFEYLYVVPAEVARRRARIAQT